MVKIGVIADTHLTDSLKLPDEVISAFANVDLILHAGDLVSLVILERLKKLNPRIYAVAGNMDMQQVKQSLAEKEIIPINQFHIGLTHGHGAPFNLIDRVKEKFKGQEVDCIVYGHSHSPRNEMRQGILYFNPGSPTDKVFAPYNSYGILEIDKDIVGKIIKI